MNNKITDDILIKVAVDTNIYGYSKLFTYRLPDELKELYRLGGEVEVPFGKNVKLGVICGKDDSPTTPLKKIKDISKVNFNSYITENQFKLGIYLSDTFMQNVYESLKLFFPINSKLNRDKEDSVGVVKNKKQSKVTFTRKLNDEQLKAFNDISASESKFHLLRGVTGSGKTEVYMRLVNECIKHGKQAAIIVPEISLTPQLVKKFEEIFRKEDICLIHYKIGKSIRRDIWEHIKSGEKKIIISSRSGIFSPFKNLGLIVIDEFHERSLFQENTPQYSTIILAEKLVKLENAKLVLSSATPSIDVFYDKKYIHHTLTQRISNKYPETIVVDLTKKNNRVDKKSMEYDTKIISQTLYEKIKEAIDLNMQSILYMNRKGFSQSIICNDCGYVERCPNCDLPLVYHNISNRKYLVCHHCYYKTTIKQYCKVCNSVDLKFLGTGIEKLSKIVEKIPGARVAILDGDSVRMNKYEETINSFINGETNILIGTQIVIKGIDIEKVYLTAYTNLDQDLVFPSFKTNETVYQRITQLLGRSSRGKYNGINIIQGYNTNNSILKLTLENDYAKFYKSEMVFRKKLKYPPYYDLIQLIVKSRTEETGLRNIKKVFSGIKKELNKHIIKKDIYLLGPSKSSLFKTKNMYYYQVTIKIKKGKLKHVKNIIKEIYSSVEKKANIRVKPFDLN